MIAPQQATRDLFPHTEEKILIRAFLRAPPRPPDRAGRHAAPDYSPTAYVVALEPKGIRLAEHLLLYYGSAGELICSIPTGMSYGHAVLLVHATLDMLGISARIERVISVPAVTGWTASFFYDGSEFKLGDPVELCGPLVIQAYRAGQNP